MKCPLCDGEKFGETKRLYGTAVRFGGRFFGSNNIEGRACLQCGWLALRLRNFKPERKND